MKEIVKLNQLFKSFIWFCTASMKKLIGIMILKNCNKHDYEINTNVELTGYQGKL